MTRTLFAANLAAWSLQVGALVCVGILAARLSGWRHPQSRLRFFQFLLAASLLLPVLAPWKRLAASPDDGKGTVTVTMGRLAPVAAPAPTVDWQGPLLLAIAAGALVQLTRLGAAIARLRRFRNSGRRIAIEGFAGVEVREVPGLKGPAAFGWASPVILLPGGMAEGVVRDNALRHELQHVIRRDWLENVGERAIAALLWFHPAIWWLIERIHVTREQAVDAEIAGDGIDRDHYIDTLLASAGLANLPSLPANSFVRRPRHLVERVAFLSKETTMTFSRTAASAALASALSAGALALAGFYLPLQLAAGPAAQQSSGNGTNLRWTRQGRAEGTVQLEATVGPEGEVIDARVIAGPDELRNNALQTVVGWRAHKDGSPRRIFTVTIDYKKFGSVPLPPPPPPPPPISQAVFEGVDYSGLSPELQQRAAIVMAPLQAGQKLTEEQFAQLKETLQAISPSLRLGVNMTRQDSDGPYTLRLSVASSANQPPASPNQIRVGGNAAQANLIEQVHPIYPALAKQARIQGTVRFTIVIDREGSVQNIQLVSGHPMLVDAAQTAVRQWKYRPVLLNGNPTAVQTTVDVNFTLTP